MLEAQLPAIAAILGFIGFGGLFLASYGIISLTMRRGRRGASIASLAVGAFLLTPILYLLIVFSLSNLYNAATEPAFFDYTADIDRIESVHLIELTEDYRYASRDSKPTYRVVREIGSDEWRALFDEIKEYGFRRAFGDPHNWIAKGRIMLMIEFSEPVEDIIRSFISEYCMLSEYTDDSGARLIRCTDLKAEDYDGFKELLLRCCEE